MNFRIFVILGVQEEAFKEAFKSFLRQSLQTNMLPAKTSREFINYSGISSQSIIDISIWLAF